MLSAVALLCFPSTLLPQCITRYSPELFNYVSVTVFLFVFMFTNATSDFSSQITCKRVSKSHP